MAEKILSVKETILLLAERHTSLTLLVVERDEMSVCEVSLNEFVTIYVTDLASKVEFDDHPFASTLTLYLTETRK